VPSLRRNNLARRAPSRRHGYVLVVTLALLVLCATVMSGIARSGLRRAIAAREAQDQLQHRWGAVSCRQATLPYAEQILATNERRLRRFSPSYTTTVQLGRQRFEIILGDEQAKANVNALLVDDGKELAQTRLREALAGTGLAAKLLLRPDPVATEMRASLNASSARSATQPAPLPPALTGWGQVFDNVPPPRLLRSGVASWITCWNNGAVNARRADERALKLAASPPLTTIDIARLTQSRSSLLQPGAAGPITSPLSNVPPGAGAVVDPVSRFLTATQTPQGGGANVGRLTASSACHSVWIVASSERRSWYHLAVLDETDPQHPRTYSSQW
jgi:hypothetical protein